MKVYEETMLRFLPILSIGMFCFLFLPSKADNNVSTTIVVYENDFEYTDQDNLKDEQFLNAMERALEICPSYRLCGNQNDSYFWDDVGLHDRYTNISEKQLNTSWLANFPCCKPCICDDSCKSNPFNWRCCPDALDSWYNDTFANMSVVPVTWNCISPVLRNKQYGNPSYYRITTTCRNSRNFEKIEDYIKLSRSCRLPRLTFNENVFVYSPKTHLVYKNQNCAECNAVGEVIKCVFVLYFSVVVGIIFDGGTGRSVCFSILSHILIGRF